MKTFFKSSLILATTLLSFSALQAQNITKDDYNALLDKKFRMGMKYQDPELTKNALVEMLILNPNRTELKDSLAIIYFGTGRFDICKTICDEIISANANNMLALELRAFSQQNLNQAIPAQKDFEALYAGSKNSYFLYQIAIIKYNGKKLDESYADVTRILAANDLDKQVIDVLFEDDMQTNVPLKAAAYNLKGMIQVAKGKREEAKTSFNEAIKLKSDFSIAKDNLKALNSAKK